MYDATGTLLKDIIHKFLPSVKPILRPLKFNSFNDFIAPIYWSILYLWQIIELLRRTVIVNL
jgi:hypothetical protein